jgi:queuine/archaeosine tRNA-ribosyltransferase
MEKELLTTRSKSAQGLLAGVVEGGDHADCRSKSDCEEVEELHCVVAIGMLSLKAQEQQAALD